MIRLVFILSILLMPALSWSEETAQDSVVFQQFIPTAFGIKSRTIDVKDADSVVKSIEDFKLQNPNVEITALDLQTCTSDYELPQNTITNKKVDEHVQLVQERHQFVAERLMKNKYTVIGKPKVCGPAFSMADLNDRFVTRESGEIFEKKFHLLLSDKTFVTQLKEDALIEDPTTLKKNYPTPFLAKFKPFQGIRLVIKGVKKNHPSVKVQDPTKPSGKNQ